MHPAPPSSTPDADPRVVIMGAGPAGLTAAYELRRHAVPHVVLEADPRYVGGIARTVEYKGYRFDIGGHRFFSKSQEVEDLWTEILGDEMLTCGRLSRIFYKGKYYAYPLKAFNALGNLGLAESARCMVSYAWARVRPVKNPKTFEDWVSNQFGKRLFRTFFKTYTEKVWGISTSELSADWAAQRIKGLNMVEVLRNALLPKKKGGREAVIKTLVDEFRYPRLGPGMMWEKVQSIMAADGNPVQMGTRVVRLHRADGRLRSITTVTADGRETEVPGGSFISTLPMRELLHAVDPPAPPEVVRAADNLRYRDFLTVAVMIRRDNLFPDNWVYIHEEGVKVGRLQNFKNWSAEMVPDPSTTCIGLEYFCFENDGLWASSDDDLVALAARELESLGLITRDEVFDGVVVRQPKAYPVYDDDYHANVEAVRLWMAEAMPNLHLVGRNGMHHYNNQDHSMMTALLVARNLATGTTFDQWKVNTDAEYHEEATAEELDRAGRQVPRRVGAA
ncbi:MAG: NAD(P)/FAD-dependent oxidoreductase [Candidatus Dormibacteria bacterium]